MLIDGYILQPKFQAKELISRPLDQKEQKLIKAFEKRQKQNKASLNKGQKHDTK